MKPLIVAIACLALSISGLAQTADEPASRDDVVLLLNTMRSHDTMQKMVDAMMKPMRQMYHDQFAKEKDKLPPDFESRMDKMMEEMVKGMPFDDMMQAMIPAYQKHFTHGDVAGLTAFYSSPVGQKFLQETPAVTGEAMQAMVPILTRYNEQWQKRIQQEIREMENDLQRRAGQQAPSHS